MIYLIDGDEPYLIEKEIEKIVGDCQNITRFNGQDSSFSCEEAINCCRSVDLFQNKSVVLINNPSFLVKIDEKKNEENSVSIFLDYVKNPCFENDLVIYTLENSFNKRSKVYKAISSNSKIISMNKLDHNNFVSAAKTIIRDSNLDINKDAALLLINYSNGSQSLLLRNIDILKNYPDRIDSNCVEKLCVEDVENTVFELIDALAFNDSNKAIKILRNLFEKEQSVFMITAIIASQLRFLYLVDYYRSINYSINDIANATSSKTYRIEMSLKKLENLTSNRILSLLSQLSDIDYLNKSNSNITPEERFELYIIKNFRGQ